MRGTILKRGKTYSIVLDHGRGADGKRIRSWHSGFRTRKEAEAARADLVSAVNAGLYVVSSSKTLAAFAMDWVNAIRVTVRPATLESYERYLRLHVIPRLGHVQLQRLTAADLNRIYGELLHDGRRDGSGGLSRRTVRYIHTILHRLLKDAVRWNLLARNVADFADPPKKQADEAVEPRAWSAGELASFLAIVRTDDLYPAFLLAATTGMRRGEVLGLRWSDVDLERKRLSVRQTLICVGHDPRFSRPKTNRGTRAIALPDSTIASLRVQSAKQAADQLKLSAAETFNPHGLVFTDSLGNLLDPESFSLTFDRRLKRSGLQRIRFHDLRHTFATLALQVGIQMKVVSEILGHSSTSVTSDIYSHVTIGMQEDATSAVESLIFPV